MRSGKGYGPRSHPAWGKNQPCLLLLTCLVLKSLIWKIEVIIVPTLDVVKSKIKHLEVCWA